MMPFETGGSCDILIPYWIVVQRVGSLTMSTHCEISSRTRGLMFFRVGAAECVILLLLLLIVVGSIVLAMRARRE